MCYDDYDFKRYQEEMKKLQEERTRQNQEKLVKQIEEAVAAKETEEEEPISK